MNKPIKLFPYQRVGARFLSSRPGAILGDQVGLGKTFQAIAAVDEAGGYNILVIAPKVVKHQWAEALLQWYQEGIAVTDKDTNLTEVKAGGRRFLLAHPEQLIDKSRILPRLRDEGWDIVIVDEVHLFKNRKSQRSKNLLTLRSNYRWGLTGTPVAERPIDLWHLLHWAAPKVFSSYWRFVQKYHNVNPQGVFGYEIGEVKNLDQLPAETSPYITVRKLEDVGIELPDLRVETVHLDLDPATRKLYADVEQKSLVHLNRDATGEAVPHKPNSLASLLDNVLFIRSAIGRIIRLQEVASHPGIIDPKLLRNKTPVKLEWLINYRDGGGRPAVVMSRYRWSSARIAEIVPSTWKVGTYASLSTGLNLQAYDTLILYDGTLSLLEYTQALGRLHRMGQTKPVIVYRLCALDTVDEYILEVTDDKATERDLVEKWLSSLGPETKKFFNLPLI